MVINIKKEYYDKLDNMALCIAKKLGEDENVTEDILECIRKIYGGTRLNRLNEENFHSSYHQSATPDAEFFISRIFFNFSLLNKLNWNILLRVQSKINGKFFSPDIRIEKEGKTLAIVEFKLKVGWIQGLFSDKRAEYDRKKMKEGQTIFDVDKFRQSEKERVDKLSGGFEVSKDKIFYLVPSLREAHRKKYETTIEDYKRIFTGVVGIPERNLILLSNNLRLNLDVENLKEKLSPRNDFESFIKMLNNSV
ncbi:MAG: hypothetical protein Q8P15_03750 [Nanoarchaeota archaeon]|nr:hypothetical protein [Nanoarchaeota archaeon]